MSARCSPWVFLVTPTCMKGKEEKRPKKRREWTYGCYLVLSPGWWYHATKWPIHDYKPTLFSTKSCVFAPSISLYLTFFFLLANGMRINHMAPEKYTTLHHDRVNFLTYISRFNCSAIPFVSFVST